MTNEQAVTLIRSSRLASEADALIAMLRPSIRIYTDLVTADIDPLASTFGGVPMLPSGVSWPAPSHSFLARFRLVDLPRVELGLPFRGHLLFFYNAGNQPWGFDPQDRGAWKVLYVEEDENLVPVEPPETKLQAQSFTACSLRFEVEQTLPDYIDESGLRISAIKNRAYEKLLLAIRSESQKVHRIGGFPEVVQGRMELECQLVSNGIYCGNASGYKDPRRAVLEHGAKDWRLLLQLDSDDLLGWMWGDAGRLYFWIRQDDLRDLNFDRVWCILQCS